MGVSIDLNSIEQAGRIVRFHRKLAGLSRLELATIAGTGKTVIFDVETGKQTVRLDTILKLFEVLNITLFLDSPLMKNFETDGNAKS